ncbi:uncharacterized protein AB675_3041 [Cyphellophora attinorum]|uniref:Uncharacterized protein n=1 Tax=Cyphellophora attinorum TaxID=1664694 RepID=A0A0N0NK87_9EURO|nr:uncharacterized protein AB675_3041 [Phialophora attinorum]KPI37861.1 hypothetical protein AB675_3041 [Phialophora attinorum]
MADPIARLVKKDQYNEQFFFEQRDLTSSKLKPSSVRIQARLLGLSANNLSYCALGDQLHWYDAFPIPDTLPTPYRNSDEYAVAPGWGYAEILESTIEELKPGRRLYGFIPTSNMVTDLKLKPSELGAPGHWTECSEHRAQVMAIYSRYFEAEGDFALGSSEYARLWKAALFPAWKSGYILNKFVFASYPEDPVVSSMPSTVPWSKADADLTQAVVITLGSRSKTCRSFVHQLATSRAPGTGPIALVEVSSTREPTVPISKWSFQHRVVTYEDASTKTSLQEIAELGAKKVVILDFAGRGTALEHIHGFFQKLNPAVQVTLIGIGSGHGKVFSKDDLQARMERSSKLESLPMNATDIIDAVIDKIGEEKTYELIHREWHRVTAEQQKSNDGAANTFLGMDLDVRGGVREEGLEKVWSQLCEGQATGNTACVVKL